ncbi:MAG: M28 family peptidase [Roseivirga sp.]|nr:M28 family peptidase [Roseivirga sp.]
MTSADQNNLYQHVEFLTTLRPYRTYLNLESLKQVTDYISAEMNSFDLEVSEQTWQAAGREYRNIIGSWAPEKEQRLIIGAHYDVCGNQPGADDNASAVAGLLETARMLTTNQPELTYGIDFVAYCLEEPPFFATREMGSYVHAKSLKDQDVNVLGMICYEMIGYFSEEPGSQPYPDEILKLLYPDIGNFIIVVGIQEHEDFNLRFHKQMSAGSGIDVQKITFPDTGGLASMSDHMNYWKFGFPALMINDTSFLRNPHYHEVTDDIDTLDFEKMTEVVTSTYRAILNL